MMLGIAFIGGEGPEPEYSRALAERAGRRGPLLIAAADSGLMSAEAAGLRPGWILGDMDSLDDPGRLAAYPPERVLRYPGEKDYTDTELACSFLWEKGCAEVWIIGGGGGRTDHLFAIRSLFERKPFPRRWITAAEDIRCVEAPAELDSGPLPESLVSVFPLGDGPWEAESRGLKWPLAGLPWNRGFCGVSNETAAGFSLRARSGRFMVMLPIVRSPGAPD